MSEIEERIFEIMDEIGPQKVIHLHEPETSMKAIIVVDNAAAGPSIGGVRMVQDVTTSEIIRLARAMTYKNAMAGLPHGGGKSGIIADSKSENKNQIIRTFARAIRNIEDYIPGPDIGTDESSMAIIYDEISRAVGLPRELGGIPLDEMGATAHGIVECVDVARGYINLDLNGASLTVEGFGNVGRPTAELLAEKGVKLVAASDSKGTIHDPDGLKIEELIRVKRVTGSVTNYKNGKVLKAEDLPGIETDIFVPAARPDTISERNVSMLKAKLVIEGANIPVTEKAEKLLHDRGVLVVPDFVANAGGVIAASVEYHGGIETDAINRISGTISRNTKEILDEVYDKRTYPRNAAVRIAKERVVRAMKYRSAR
ncbi:MAG: Glu/Leu/Phe/Val dehydrogenase [Nitrososphaerota archaeon]|nr:Glu/Leu/Phe/Val dehydrogenase [Nitrososphaerota archaeon]